MESEGPDRRLLAKLAIGALATLGIGAMLRPADPGVEAPISLTESPTLRTLSRRNQFRDMAEFAAEQVGVVAPHLVYLPELGRSGVRWRSGDSAVTAGDDDASVALAPVTGADSGAVPATILGVELDQPRWVLVVARTSEGGIVSSIGLSSGVVPTTCNGREQPALLLSTPLPRPLGGAGVFDLDGSLLAVVAACGQSYAALPAGDIDTALEDSRTADRSAWGVELGELDSLSRREFQADSGAPVVAVTLAGAGDRAGLRPGDVVLNPEMLDAVPDSAAALQVIRSGRVVRLPPPPPADSTDALGVDFTPAASGVEIGVIGAHSPAERAGLRPGDRVIRLGSLEHPSRDAALRALRAAGSEPLYVVFRRGRQERGSFLLP